MMDGGELRGWSEVLKNSPVLIYINFKLDYIFMQWKKIKIVKLKVA